MAIYNSFYGGRRGASFVLVKNYLDIPQMTNDFAKGNDCEDVAFEEYVLINNPNKNHPDNGKIFRRGYDFNSNKTISGYVLVNKEDNSILIGTDSEYEAALGDSNYDFKLRENIQAHGAEYIGTIVGPAGKAPLLNITSYEDTQGKHAAEGFEERTGTGKYSPNGENPGLIPGKYEENGETKYHDSIEWCYTSIRNDKFGDDTQAYIGFKFPYLVTQMSVQQVTPYDEEGKIANKVDITRQDDKTHPYYNKWHLQIPKGIQGDAIKNLRITYFNRYAENASNSDEKKDPLYNAQGQEILNPKTSQFDIDFFKNKYGDSVVTDGISLNELLSKLEGKAILVYDKFNFDNKQTGDIQYYYLGDYNEIESIELTKEGQLNCILSHDGKIRLNANTSDAAEEDGKIRWIKNISFKLPYEKVQVMEADENGENITGTGSTSIRFGEDDGNNLTINYNTGASENFNIPFVKNVIYNDTTGSLKFQLAGEHNGLDGIDITKIEYIDDVNYDNESGNSNLIFTTNLERQKEVSIPAIKSVEIENIQVDNLQDGEGNPITRPCLVVYYYNQEEPVIIADPFEYLKSFNLDAETGTISFQKNNETESHDYIIPYVDNFRYDKNTAQIQYHINGTDDTVYKETGGSLPIIKNFAIDENSKEILVQFGTNFEDFDGNNYYEPSNTTKYSPLEHWYRIGSTISEKVVMGGIITNFNMAKLNDLLQAEPDGTPIEGVYEGAESYDIGENPVINALNLLYPNGRLPVSFQGELVSSTDYTNSPDWLANTLRVITFGDENQNKEYFAYDWSRSRVVNEGDDNQEEYGTWYYLGGIKAINNVSLSESLNDKDEGRLLFMKKRDICSISIQDNISGCTFKNPMTKIQIQHRYINTITGPGSLGINVTIGINGGNQSSSFVNISGNSAVIDIPDKNVTGDIVIQISERQS